MSTPVWKGLHRLWSVMATATEWQNGYVYVKYPDHPVVRQNGYVPLHRLVMENHLGRYLEPQEVVHHRDCDKTNNRIENLELCANSAEHSQRHRDQGTLGFLRKIEWPSDAELFALLRRMTIGAVAKKLGVARDSVVRWCRVHGVEEHSIVGGQLSTVAVLCPTKKELQALVDQKPLFKIATQFNVSVYAVRKWCKSLSIKFTRGKWHRKNPPNREELCRLLNESVAAAMRHYGVSRPTVKNWAIQLGLSWNSDPGMRSSGQATRKDVGLNNIFYSVDILVDTAAQICAGKMTLQAAATELHCTTNTYRRRCARQGIILPNNLRTVLKRPSPPKSELQQRLVAGASCAQIAREYETNEITCRTWLRRYGLSSDRWTKKAANKPDRKTMQQLVWEKSVPRIAAELGVSATTLRKWIRQYNITNMPPRGYWVRKEICERAAE